MSQKDLEDHPEKELLQNRSALITLIDRLITYILSQTRLRQIGTSKFHCKQRPSVSFTNFLLRVAKFAHCSNTAYVAALIYIDRFQQRVPDFIINDFCIHSVMVATKYYDDFYYKNSYYAKVGGISLQDINTIELELLLKLDYRLHIENSQFNSYLRKLHSFQKTL